MPCRNNKNRNKLQELYCDTWSIKKKKITYKIYIYTCQRQVLQFGHYQYNFTPFSENCETHNSFE